MTRRDALAALLCAFAVVATYAGTLAPVAAGWIFEQFGWAERDLAAYYDPNGMLEGEGFDDAPEDAVPGQPDAVAELEPSPVPEEEPASGEPTPSTEAPVEAPVPEPPLQPEVALTPVPDLDGAAEVELPETPDEPPAEPAAETPPTDRPSTAPSKPSPKDPKPPVSGTPGVDPTKAKDQGVKGGTTNTAEDCNTPHPQIKATPGRTDHWTIQKSLIEYYTSSIPIFNTLGWSRKYEDDQGVKGWQIGGFGCRGPLWKAGLRSRDVIQSVNGKKTNNVTQIIGLWLFSKKKGDFEVVLVRKGKEITLHYTVEVD